MRPIRFLLDDEVVEIGDIDPTTTVLDWLRYAAGRTGTKEGCAEGDCGACTVVVGELKGDAVVWRAVNACILFMPMLDGKVLKTVESLGGDHPVQKAMVECHGSQCGFCTPGIVMSLYGRSIGATGTYGVAPKDVLAGNLCRCTGYGPILAAAEANPPDDFDDSATAARLGTLVGDQPLVIGNWTTPQTVDQLAEILVERPDARIIAGATDVGLWVTKEHRRLDDVVYIGDIAELAQITETDEGLTLGAGVRYSDAHDALGDLHKDLGELVRRIGAVQVRNSGTIGGNIANGSPIGDMPPALIALGATLTLRRGSDRRVIPLEDYFIAYGQQDRQPGEFVESVYIPHTDNFVRIVKQSKRFDSDISVVCAAFNLTIVDDVIVSARIAFGGMAGTPKRAPAVEAALTGQPFDDPAFEAAALAVAVDFQPLSDVRGSSDYRLTVAANLVRDMWRRPRAVLDVRPIEVDHD